MAALDDLNTAVTNLIQALNAKTLSMQTTTSIPVVTDDTAAIEAQVANINAAIEMVNAL